VLTNQAATLTNQAAALTNQAAALTNQAAALTNQAAAYPARGQWTGTDSDPFPPPYQSRS
jgi:hypothetical protein